MKMGQSLARGNVESLSRKMFSIKGRWWWLLVQLVGLVGCHLVMFRDSPKPHTIYSYLLYLTNTLPLVNPTYAALPLAFSLTDPIKIEFLLKGKRKRKKGGVGGKE